MNDGAGLSTAELFPHAATLLRQIEQSLKTRRGKDRACMALTDLFLAINAIGQRMGEVEFVERPPSIEDEDEGSSAPRRAEMSLMEVMGEDDDAHEERALQLECLRRIIRFTCHGCNSADAVTRKWLALVRRVDPSSLSGIGLSQTAVARALGERRATTSKREMREFEAPVIASGARGWRNAGGARSEANRRNCAKAQKGNRNRAKGRDRADRADD
ncbi:MAG: hypothetical protein Q8M07_08335 [Prosthecobacter sp.]|nr:hypothetical protein [Prosthecobacter sp.]